MRVAHQSIIVTGAGNGIGEGIAKRLASEGASVTVNDINAVGGQRVVDEIVAAGGTAQFVQADVTCSAEVKALVDAAVQALADALQPLAPNAVVTGLPLGKYIGCAGTGADRFVIKKLHISRSFPGTGDLYGAVLIGSLLQGNALSAAADNAAEFVSLAIQGTPCTQDTRFGVWFEPLLPRLCPLREEPEGIL